MPSETPKAPRSSPSKLDALRNERDCGRLVCATNAWFLQAVAELLHRPLGQARKTADDLAKLLRNLPGEGGVARLPVWQVASAHAVLAAQERDGQVETLCQRYRDVDPALDLDEHFHDACDATEREVSQGPSPSGVLGRSISGLLSQLRSRSGRLQAERFADHIGVLRAVAAAQESMLESVRSAVRLGPGSPNLLPTIIQQRASLGHVLHIDEGGSRCLMSIPVLLGAAYKAYREEVPQATRPLTIDEFIVRHEPWQFERSLQNPTPALLAGCESGRLYLNAVKGKDYPQQEDEGDLIFDERVQRVGASVLIRLTESEPDNENG